MMIVRVQIFCLFGDVEVSTGQEELISSTQWKPRNTFWPLCTFLGLRQNVAFKALWSIYFLSFSCQLGLLHGFQLHFFCHCEDCQTVWSFFKFCVFRWHVTGICGMHRILAHLFHLWLRTFQIFPIKSNRRMASSAGTVMHFPTLQCNEQNRYLFWTIPQYPTE